LVKSLLDLQNLMLHDIFGRMIFSIDVKATTCGTN